MELIYLSVYVYVYVCVFVSVCMKVCVYAWAPTLSHTLQCEIWGLSEQQQNHSGPEMASDQFMSVLTQLGT